MSEMTALNGINEMLAKGRLSRYENDILRNAEREIATLATQRDALLAACQELIECLDPFSGDICFQEEKSARAAVEQMVAAMKLASPAPPTAKTEQEPG